MMFRSYSNISKYFLRDYGTMGMVIVLVTMVTITTVISSRVKIACYTCEDKKFSRESSLGISLVSM